MTANQKDPQWEAKLQRQHRLIAVYSLLQCGVKGVDGLVLTEPDLIQILNIKRPERSHLRQFATNIHEFFPFVVPVWLPSTKKVFACIISRRPLEGIPKNREFDIFEQIAALKQNGINVSMFSMWELQKSKTPLAALKSQLVSLIQGGPSITFLKYISYLKYIGAR